MVRRAAVLAAAITAGCSGSGERGDEDVVLRVTSGHGFGEFVPGPGQGGAAAYALPLVFEPLAEYAHVAEVRGEEVTLEVSPTSPLSPEEVARAIRFRDLVDAEAVEGGRVLVRFAGEEPARRFSSWGYGVLDIGPFELVSTSEAAVKLRARGAGDAGSKVDMVEILSVPEEEQWRRLLARNVDVVPVTDATRAENLADVGSIRTFPVPRSAVYGLVFNVNHPELPASIRRAVASAIDAPAMAKIACGSAECARPPSGIESSDGGDLALPRQFSVLVQESDDVARRAAAVLRYQFARQDVEVAIDSVSAQDGFARISSGSFDAVLMPLTLEPDELLLDRLRMFGFESEELEAAIRRGDRENALAILGREIPFISLFEARYYAAVDRRFCGARPEGHTSWRWLADLRLCDEGSAR